MKNELMTTETKIIGKDKKGKLIISTIYGEYRITSLTAEQIKRFNNIDWTSFKR